MIRGGGDVKILDFGLAKLRDADPALVPTGAPESHATAEGRVMGTPPYMSPEQAEGRLEVDARTDIFSFGAMLYEMLSGVPAFPGGTSVAVPYAVVHREAQPLEAVCPDVPPAIAALVARCLKKPKEERFAGGRELFAALEEAGGGRFVSDGSGKAQPAGRVSNVSGMGTRRYRASSAPSSASCPSSS